METETEMMLTSITWQIFENRQKEAACAVSLAGTLRDELRAAAAETEGGP